MAGEIVVAEVIDVIGVILPLLILAMAMSAMSGGLGSGSARTSTKTLPSPVDLAWALVVLLITLPFWVMARLVGRNP